MVSCDRDEVMNDQELDQTYTALCHALASVGEAQSQSFLSMLCLSLIAHSTSAADVLPLIKQAVELCASHNSQNAN